VNKTVKRISHKKPVKILDIEVYEDDNDNMEINEIIHCQNLNTEVVKHKHKVVITINLTDKACFKCELPDCDSSSKACLRKEIKKQLSPKIVGKEKSK